MKFCKDCFYYEDFSGEPALEAHFAKCGKEEFMDFNIVTGEKEAKYCVSCRILYPEKCGKNGRGWKPKNGSIPKSPSIRLIKESDSGPFCKKCGSSLKRKWIFFRTDKCINSECENHYVL